MKVEKKSESFYIVGYQLEHIIKIWQFGFYFILKSGNFGPFFREKSFVQVEIIFFWVKIWRKFGKIS